MVKYNIFWKEKYDLLKNCMLLKNTNRPFQKQNDSLVENNIAVVRSELSKVQIPENSAPFRMTEPEDKSNADESMDVAYLEPLE